MEDLPSPYGDCEASEDYVESNCLANCQSNYVIGKCNCKDIYMPGENKMHETSLAWPFVFIAGSFVALFTTVAKFSVIN